MHILLILLFLLVLVFGPQWWAQYTFRRYAEDLPRIPGTGGELARHLLDQFGMADVAVEKSEKGADHYDPERREGEPTLQPHVHRIRGRPVPRDHQDTTRERRGADNRAA